MNMAVTPPTLIAAKKALDKAKITLMTKADSAFFTTVCFSLKHVWDESIPTAATDGLSILFNPDFFVSLSKEEQVFLLLHEVGHVIFSHMTRRGARDPRVWNYAGDYVINAMLIERSFKMPEGGLYEARFKEMSTDQVYDILIKENPQTEDRHMDIIEGGGSGDKDAAAGGGTPQDKAAKEAAASDLQNKIDDILIRASVQSRMQGDKPGTIPGSIQIFLDKLLNPKLPWQSILRKYMNNMNKVDYSWRRPNRRFFPDHHLPSLYSEALVDIAVAVDTSGSVSDQEFHRFVSEVASIFKSHKPKKITLIQFDTSLKAINEVHSLEELKALKFTGRGGTIIRPVIDWVHENKPQLMMIFSDGGFHHYNQPVKSPLLWMIHDNPKFDAPYGKVIHYEV
jgi:predicted metal-dependent peptidase